MKSGIPLPRFVRSASEISPSPFRSTICTLCRLPPEEGAAYSDEIPELTEKAKKWKEEQKAKAAEAARAAKTKK